jgi:hypothetical protein
MEKEIYYPNNLINEYLDDQNKFDLLIKDLEQLKNHTSKGFPVKILATASYKPLDLDSRKADPTRQFMHIHQTCTSLVNKYITSTKIKALNLIDGFFDSYNNSNHLICCFIGRYSIELNSLVFRINSKLTKLYNANNNDWLTNGESFFWEIFRANFGSKDERFKDNIRKYEKFSNKKMMPLDLTKSMEILSNNNDSFKNLSDEYDYFSEYVHHNIQSITSNISGHRITDTPIMTSEGVLIPAGNTIEEYHYPQTRHHRILNIALYTFQKHISYLLSVLDEFPFSPFSKELCFEKTGNPNGARSIPPEQNQNSFNDSLKKTGRNQKCHCGSNKKYKNCCMNR